MGATDQTLVRPLRQEYLSDPRPVAQSFLEANIGSGAAAITSVYYPTCEPKRPTDACTGEVRMTVRAALARNVMRAGLGVGAAASTRPVHRNIPDSGS